MPYIPETDRARAREEPTCVGELTYSLTRTCMEYLDSGPTRFQSLAEVLGALEATRAEFYRRVVAPYEDGKREKNGDVYVGPK